MAWAAPYAVLDVEAPSWYAPEVWSSSRGFARAMSDVTLDGASFTDGHFNYKTVHETARRLHRRLDMKKTCMFGLEPNRLESSWTGSRSNPRAPETSSARSSSASMRYAGGRPDFQLKEQRVAESSNRSRCSTRSMQKRCESVPSGLGGKQVRTLPPLL